MKIKICDICLAESAGKPAPTLNPAVWRIGTRTEKIDTCHEHHNTKPPKLNTPYPKTGSPLDFELLSLGATAESVYNAYQRQLLRVAELDTKKGRKG